MMYGREKAREYKNTFVKIQGTGTNFLRRTVRNLKNWKIFLIWTGTGNLDFLNVITGITVI